MTDPVGPVGPVGKVERRAGDRRDDEHRSGQPKTSRSLVPAGPVVDETPAASEQPARHTAPVAEASPTAFAAQLLGQTGGRKGLRGGPPVLDAARSAYLGNEYSGERERRPPPGKGTKTEV